MRTITLFPPYISAALLAVCTTAAAAQNADSQTRAAAIEEAEAQKVTTLQPYVPSRGERRITRVQNTFVNPSQTWHPFFENAYHGGGFAAGLGYMWHVSPYNYLDVRGSYSIRWYKRAEVEFDAPRLFHRRGELTIVAGWRDAAEVGFYGLGMDTASSDRANYGFERPAVGAVLTVRPTRRLLLLRGSLDFSRWDLKSGTGGRSVEDVYTPETLTGLGATTTYLHSLATAGFDWRPASGYARRGGFYAVTAHDYHDRDDRFGFDQLDYEVIQHIPIRLRSEGYAPASERKADAVQPRRHRRAAAGRCAQAGRVVPRRCWPASARQGHRQLPIFGYRPDDPNDLVAHEHRRELRALRVFGAWTNLTDLKAANTLDTLVTESGHSVVKHWLQDVGSTFGMCNDLHEWDLSWEHFIQGGTTMKRLASFGFALSPWQTVDYVEGPSIGKFEGDRFDPREWRPQTPTAAYMELRDDDAFWAARRVAAFSDEMIRAIVHTGQFSAAAAEKAIADIVIKRRDKILAAYLPAVNPIVGLTLENDRLTFENAAVAAHVAQPPASYRATWAAFDNATGETRPIGETTGTTDTITAPAGLPSGANSFIAVNVAAESPEHAAWRKPVQAYFRRTASGWQLVGLERQPDVDHAIPR